MAAALARGRASPGARSRKTPFPGRIGIRDSGVCQRIAGVFVDGLLKILESFFHIFGGALVQ